MYFLLGCGMWFAHEDTHFWFLLTHQCLSSYTIAMAPCPPSGTLMYTVVEVVRLSVAQSITKPLTHDQLVGSP